MTALWGEDRWTISARILIRMFKLEEARRLSRAGMARVLQKQIRRLYEMAREAAAPRLR